MTETAILQEPAKEKKEKRRKKRIRVCFLRVEDLSEESRRRLFEAGRQCQEAVNRIWQSWEQAMLAAGRDADLRIFLELYNRWKKRGVDKSDPPKLERGADLSIFLELYDQWKDRRIDTSDRPKLEFAPIDPKWVKRVTATLREEYPGLHSRVVTLLVSAAVRRILSLPSRTCGRLKLWQAVLLSRESPCRSFSILPVPFDAGNASLAERPEDDTVTLGVRIDRFEIPDRVNGGSHLETMRLRIEGRAGKKRYAQWAREAARGERLWAGSQVVYDARKRRWHVALAVEVDPVQPLPILGQAELTAPAESACWLLASGERQIRIGGGSRVEHLRRRLQASRFGTGSDPFGAPSRTGHGRKRRQQAARAREGKWGRVTKTLNRQAAARIIKELGAWGVTMLDYHVPSGDCLLNTAGKEVGLPAWPIYQFGEFLGQKCEEAGITLRILTAQVDASAEAATGFDVSVVE